MLLFYLLTTAHAVFDNASFQRLLDDKLQFTNVNGPEGVDYGGNEYLQLVMNSRFDNPFVTSEFYIHFGKVEAEVMAAPGRGIVSSFYLQSDDLDEIDIEMFGGDPFEFQTNYFVKGNTSNYERGAYHNTPGSPLTQYFTYGIDWTPEVLSFTLNGNIVRQVHCNNPHGYPTSPMKVKFSLWAGGDPENEIGTIEWAGGESDFSQLPTSMHIRRFNVERGYMETLPDTPGTLHKTQPESLSSTFKWVQFNDSYVRVANGGNWKMGAGAALAMILNVL